jgi:hypothetical protein
MLTTWSRLGRPNFFPGDQQSCHDFPLCCNAARDCCSPWESHWPSGESERGTCLAPYFPSGQVRVGIIPGTGRDELRTASKHSTAFPRNLGLKDLEDLRRFR